LSHWGREGSAATAAAAAAIAAFDVALAFAGMPVTTFIFCLPPAYLDTWKEDRSLMFPGATQTAFAGPISLSSGDLEGAGGRRELDEDVMVMNSVMVFGSAGTVIVVGSSMVIVTVVVCSTVGFETGGVMYEKEKGY